MFQDSDEAQRIDGIIHPLSTLYLCIIHGLSTKDEDSSTG